MNQKDRSRLREHLTQIRSTPALERVHARARSLSSGDRVIFYALATLVTLASLASLYELEQSILVRVPAYGGSIVEGEVGSPQFINPLLAISDADRDLSMLTYAGLMGLSGDGSLAPVLAESYATSGDGKSYTFKIRPDAVFTDGTPVTANDVVFTIRKAKDATLKSPEYANWSGVDVTAVDAQTIRFTLAKPYAPFLELTTIGILPAHIWENISNAEFPFSTLETNPIGAGPFKVTSIARDTFGLIRSVVLTANSKYVLGRPYIDSIRFNFYTNADALATAFKTGAIESAYGISTKDALTAPYARVFGVFFNPNEQQLYARPEVRKALSIALDRDAIIADALSGYATPIMGPVPPGNNIRQAAIPQSSNTVADAANVLSSAGWKYDAEARGWKIVSGGKSVLSGKQILDKLTIRTSNVPELKNVASAVKTYWEQFGISTEIELYEPGDLSQNVIRPRKYDTLLYGMVIGRDQDLYAFWDSQERNDPGLNIALYANKTVDTLLEDARSTVDRKKRDNDLQKIEDIIAADYPAAFIYAPDFIYATPKDLYGVELPQITTPSDRFANVASWYRLTDSVWPFFAK